MKYTTIRPHVVEELMIEGLVKKLLDFRIMGIPDLYIIKRKSTLRESKITWNY